MKHHRMHLQKMHLADRERRRFGQSNAQQRAGTGDMVLRCILAKVLQGIDDLRAVLHFVKNNERFLRKDLLAAGHHQILKDPINILRCIEERFVFFVLLEVEIGRILVIKPAELSQRPGLADLSNTF